MTRARDVANVLSTATSLATDTETAAAISSHASLTSTHGVSGSIVGTTDTQTLSNKTLSGTVTVSGDINLTAVGAAGSLNDEISLIIMGSI